MPISDERVKEFAQAYKKEFNEDISLDEARDMLTRLVILYTVIARLLPGEASGEKDDKP
jgi:hypothetical protein